MNLFNPKVELLKIIYPHIKALCKVKGECHSCRRNSLRLAKEIYAWHKENKLKDIDKYFQDIDPYADEKSTADIENFVL